MDRNTNFALIVVLIALVALHRSAWIEINCGQNVFRQKSRRTPQECVDRNSELQMIINKQEKSHSTGVRG